jgi:hypothetical protein
MGKTAKPKPIFTKKDSTGFVRIGTYLVKVAPIPQNTTKNQTIVLSCSLRGGALNPVGIVTAVENTITEASKKTKDKTDRGILISNTSPCLISLLLSDIL